MYLIIFLRWKIQKVLTVLLSKSDPGGHRFIGCNCYLCGRHINQDPMRCSKGKATSNESS